MPMGGGVRTLVWLRARVLVSVQVRMFVRASILALVVVIIYSGFHMEM
jgi:hypothetical protein